LILSRVLKIDIFNYLIYLIIKQVKKIEELRVKIRLEKEKVERAMERQQMSMAGRRMVELARLVSQVMRIWEGMGPVDVLVEVALKGLLGGLERVMAADCGG
jgi:hypothetical protein